MFGKILRELRKSSGITQIELANILNLDASTISKYEKADVTPSADVLLKVSQHFLVSTDYLLGITDTKKAPSIEDADLSPDERALLEQFRQASPALQDAALRVLESDLKKEKS